MTAMQAEAGFGCPITMTFAAVPALRAQPELAAEWEPLLTVDGYDRALSRAARRAARSCGMAMTEKQGGSDVRANTTVATPLTAAARAEYEIDRAQVVLLGADVRHVPRARADRRRPLLLLAAAHPARRHAQRGFHIQRLKDKLGNQLQRLLARSSSTAPGRGWSASPAAACRRSSRWSATRAWTA